MQNENEQALQELLESINFLIENFYKKTTKIYNGVVVFDNADGTYNVKYNGHTEKIKFYGELPPYVGKTVKVYIPQGNVNLSYFS